MNNSNNSISKKSNSNNSLKKYIIIISVICFAFIGFLIYLIVSNKFHENFANAYTIKNKICKDFDKIFVNIPIENSKKDLLNLYIYPQTTRKNKRYNSVHSNDNRINIEGNTHKSKEQSNAEFFMILAKILAKNNNHHYKEIITRLLNWGHLNDFITEHEHKIELDHIEGKKS